MKSHQINAVYIEPQYDINNWSLTAYEHEPNVLNNMFDFPRNFSAVVRCPCYHLDNNEFRYTYTQITRFMGPTWGPPGADRTMLATWTLLYGYCSIVSMVNFSEIEISEIYPDLWSRHQRTNLLMQIDTTVWNILLSGVDIDEPTLSYIVRCRTRVWRCHSPSNTAVRQCRLLVWISLFHWPTK